MMPHKRRGLRSSLGVVALIAAISAVGWLMGPTGTVYGVQFSPDRCSHRSFRYYQWCGVQVTPKQTREWRSDLDTYIQESGFAVGGNAENPRWHFVKGFAPGVRGWHGDAKYMCQSVGCWSGNDRWLIAWSKNHPDLAKVIWPQVIMWARDERYYEIMLLFRLTNLEDATSPEDIREKVKAAEMGARV